jgi:hypothetical protein
MVMIESRVRGILRIIAASLQPAAGTRAARPRTLSPEEEAMHRNHKMLRMLAALLLAGFASQASAEEFEGWVYDGLTGWGKASSNGFDDSAMTSNPSLGYRWGAWGVEVGHACDGTLEDSQVDGPLTIDAGQRIHGWTVGVDFNHDLAERWSLRARAGWFAWDAKTQFDDHVGPDLEFDDSGDDWYAGATLQWQWRKTTSLGIGYTHYNAGDTDVDVVGFSSEYRFGAGK